MSVEWLGRLLLVILFLWSGLIQKPSKFGAIAEILGSRGIPVPHLALAAAILLEISGALVIISPRGFLPREVTLTAIGMLMAYSLLTAAMFHNFWRLEKGLARDHDMASFLKNFGLCGGFLLVAVHL